MIRLTVVSYNNRAPEQPMSAVFGADGKTVGRGEDNHLILPDPKQLVSRVQAAVRSDGNRHSIANLGKESSILVNGKPLESDRETALQVGDEIHVGLYVLRAEAHLSAVAGTLEAPAAAEQPAARAAAAAQLALELGADDPDPAAAPAKAARAKAERAEAAAADNAALVQAFLNGAGIPNHTPPPALTPEFMETIGKLLAGSVQGLVELSALRAFVKREVNADVTMVVVRNNNPIKFFHDAETVLTQMFRKKMPGFMGPVEAIDDAFHDLHAHQLGVVAGIRAAMAHTLARINPERLEKKLEAPSWSDSMFPNARKGKLWDMYVERYHKIQKESQDEFQGLFGDAFLKAYELEIERINTEAAG